MTKGPFRMASSAIYIGQWTSNLKKKAGKGRQAFPDGSRRYQTHELQIRANVATDFDDSRNRLWMMLIGLWVIMKIAPALVLRPFLGA